MKRTVKLLAALLSLLVLGTTLSVPVTAVGSDDSVSPFSLEYTYAIYSEDFEVYDPSGFLALLGHGVAYYNDRNKMFTVNTYADAFDDVSEEQYQVFNASSNAQFVYDRYGEDYELADTQHSTDLYDYLDTYIYEGIEPNILIIYAMSNIGWGDIGNADECSGRIVVDEDFTY